MNAKSYSVRSTDHVTDKPEQLATSDCTATSSTVPAAANTQRLWRRVGRWCADGLLALFLPSAGPTITQRRDRSGRIVYIVRDPATDTQVSLDSEADVRVWLEKRF